MIVGRNQYEIGEEVGSLTKLLEIKRYFDGRHSIEEIAGITDVPIHDILRIVITFNRLGLLRKESTNSDIPTGAFIDQVASSCCMWRRQIGFHQLFGKLERVEVRPEVFVGLILETYHYVRAATHHISTAISHCGDPDMRSLLGQYLDQEHDHYELFIDALGRMGLERDQVVAAHPIIGTMSLINILCEIGRQNTLAYIACTSLIEARDEDVEGAKETIQRMAILHGFDKSVVQPLVSHMEGDVQAGHNSMLKKALARASSVNAKDAHCAVNCLHDLKHSFDQFHDQVLMYYSDISNYIPRLTVDYFSL
jgi:pyrroloquinoline quinone (PQQ) biosynthesis protein C